MLLRACSLAHITVCEVNLKGDKEISVAQEAIASLQDEFSAMFGSVPFTVAIKGLASFGASVLFAKLDENHASTYVRFTALRWGRSHGFALFRFPCVNYE